MLNVNDNYGSKEARMTIRTLMFRLRDEAQSTGSLPVNLIDDTFAAMETIFHSYGLNVMVEVGKVEKRRVQNAANRYGQSDNIFIGIKEKN